MQLITLLILSYHFLVVLNPSTPMTPRKTTAMEVYKTNAKLYETTAPVATSTNIRIVNKTSSETTPVKQTPEDTSVPTSKKETTHALTTSIDISTEKSTSAKIQTKLDVSTSGSVLGTATPTSQTVTFLDNPTKHKTTTTTSIDNYGKSPSTQTAAASEYTAKQNVSTSKSTAMKTLIESYMTTAMNIELYTSTTQDLTTSMVASTNQTLHDMVTTLHESTTQDFNISMMGSTNQTLHDMVTAPDESTTAEGVYCCLFHLKQIVLSVSNIGEAYDVDFAFFYVRIVSFQFA